MRALALLGPVLAVPFLARGGANEASIRWAPSWSAAIEEAKARNVPVLVIFGKDHWGGCEALESGTLANKEFVAYVNESAVCLTGHSGRDHGTIDVVDPKTKEKTTRCKKFPSITCDDHESAGGQARSGGGFDFKYLPQSYVVDPEGKTLADLQGAFAKKQGIEKLKEAAKKLGPGMSGSAWAKAQAALGEGDSALSGGDLKKALERYRAAVREKGTTKALEESVAAKITGVEAKGLEAVNAAKGESDPAVAKKKLQAIAQDLAGTKAAEAAQAAIAALG